MATRRRRARVRHIHSSSRFDRSALSLVRAVAYYILFADLLTFTEVANDRRAQALRALGWRRIQMIGKPGVDECAVMFLRLKWRYVTHNVTLLSQQKLANGRWLYALTVELEHRRTKQRLLVSVTHLPAHIQGPGRIEQDAQGRIYTAAVKTWHNFLMVSRRPGLSIMAVADWNLDVRLSWVREWLTRMFIGLRSSWGARSRPLPEDGTHGSRLIDDTRSNMTLYRIDLLRDDDSSDHRPYREVLLLPRID